MSLLRRSVKKKQSLGFSSLDIVGRGEEDDGCVLDPSVRDCWFSEGRGTLVVFRTPQLCLLVVGGDGDVGCVSDPSVTCHVWGRRTLVVSWTPHRRSIILTPARGGGRCVG